MAHVLLGVVALGGLSNACSFLGAPARAHVVGQATSSSLLGAVQLAGVACLAKQKWIIIYHGACVAHSHSSFWGCGGVGNENVVERGWGWWVDAPEQCTCAVIYACSYVLVGLICVTVHFSHVLSPMYVSHLWFVFVGSHLFFLGHGVF